MYPAGLTLLMLTCPRGCDMRQARAPWLSKVDTRSLVLLDFENLFSANHEAAFNSGLFDVEPWFI